MVFNNQLSILTVIMNKIYRFLIVVAILLIAVGVTRADIVVTLPDTVVSPGTELKIPVRIYGADVDGSPISAADIRFTFDASKLTYLGVTSFYSGLPSNQWIYGGNNGLFSANWIEPNFGTVEIPDGTVLFEVKFTAKPGSCPLVYSFLEFLDASYNAVNATGVNGHYASIQPVVFKVDMRDQVVSASGVHLAGSFNNWNTSTNQMVASGSVYSTSVDLISDSLYTYRFVNGNSSSGYETVPVTCGIVGPGGSLVRSISVNQTGVQLPSVCFSSCDACPPLVNVTFKVDMSTQSVNAQGVHVMGSFNNWSPTSTAMVNLGNGVYGCTVQALNASTIQWRYVNGASSGLAESVPSTCGVAGPGGQLVRSLQLAQNDTILDTVCYSMCSGCPLMVPVTFRVDMSQQTINGNGVHVATSLDGYLPTTNLMTNLGNNVYTYTIEIEEGSFLTYRYVNGNTSSDFEAVPSACGIPDGMGNLVRSITIGQSPVIIDEVCFGSCTDCVSNPDMVDVTFTVDMSKEVVSADGVYLKGDFNGWSANSNQMISVGNSRYMTILSISKNTPVRYRFANGFGANTDEIVPTACGFNGISGLLEREVVLSENDTILPEVCFSRCDLCPLTPRYNVTFQVEMDLTTVSPFGVHLSGNFNEWSTTADQLTNTIGHVYSITMPIDSGLLCYYRFTNGVLGSDMEVVPAECGSIYNGSDLARSFIIKKDTILSGVCFGHCVPCSGVSINETELDENAINLYPIPACNDLNIGFTGIDNADVTIRISDVIGRVVLMMDRNSIEDDLVLTVPLNDLFDGVYITEIIIRQRDGRTIRKVARVLKQCN